MKIQTLPEAVVVHFTTNRLRLRISSQKRNHTYFKTLATMLSDIDGVSAVDVNPITGSVLMSHNLELKMLIDRLNEKGHFKIKMDNGSKGNLHKQIESFFTDANRKVIKATGGELNLPMLIFISLLSTSLLQIIRGQFNAIPWYTALWYAYSLFKKGKGNNNSAVG